MVKRRLFWKIWIFEKGDDYQPLTFTNFNKVVKYVMNKQKGSDK